MNRRRALAWLASALYFGAALLSVHGHDAPPVVQAAAAWGLGASLSASAVWWGRGAGNTTSTRRTSERPR